MTPDRRKEIRAEIDGWGDTMPYHLRLAQELLAEVDRLEAVVEKVRGVSAGLRQAAKLDDARRLELIAQEQQGILLPVWDVHEKLIPVIRMDLSTTTADALEAAITRPLDSPPAKR